MSALGEVWERPGGERGLERIELCGQRATSCGVALWRYRRLDQRGERGLVAPADLLVGWRRVEAAQALEGPGRVAPE